ncbi:GNAT family N-acetyltransferase [Pseudoroseicyclus aestuarii]|uniref:RimJ/RimL family protein N-acetyltransferase n=1 Tax=Pseudoroseicyclus aestuarii TaxID=1795041 RepID=A0A318SW38_9RHOB|nr:GNAT family N-acetyltransferase [Pseudoroseicyclus aestuarii]PYE86141.1 RimJ/RimL family protein N-acetyltransferase [Pseudoroseicyclus aestuarii]
MTPRLTTARLVLRGLEARDAPAIQEGLSDWEVARWLSAPPWPYGREDADWFIHEAEGQHYAIDAGEGLIGVISVKPDLGYWLRRDHHGRGLMSEAAEAAVQAYFETTQEPLVSGHFEGNAASRRVLTKLGFRDTAPEVTFARPLGQDVTVQRMRLTADDWRASRA